MLRKLFSFFDNKNLMGYLRNSAWMLSEYALKIISGIFVGIYVARYLGPEDFGILSYALAIVSVFTVICRLGMDSILVRDLSIFPESKQDYMGTAFYMMLFASVASLLMLVALVYILKVDTDVRVYILTIAMGMIFQPIYVIDFDFQSEIKARYSSMAKSFALAIAASLKIYLVWIQADLSVFAVIYAFELLITALALYFLYALMKKPSFIGRIKFALIKPLLRSAWPMVLASVTSILYSRVDQLMIESMLGAYELGIYSAAIKVFEGWVIIPSVVSISLLPAIVKLKSSSVLGYELSLTKVFSVLFWLGVFVAIFIMFTGVKLVEATYGAAFSETYNVLIIIMLAAPFTALGSMTARYLTVEGMEQKIAFRTLVGLFVNFGLNLVMIPIYGIEGAAIATLVTLFVANYLINYVDRDLRQLASICNAAITMRWLWNGK